MMPFNTGRQLRLHVILKKSLSIFGLVIALLWCGGNNPPLFGAGETATPQSPRLFLQIDFTSRYIWRGIDLLDNNQPALQPSITYVFGNSGLSVNLFASFVLKNREHYKSADELDITVNYDFYRTSHLSLSAGMTNYGFYYIPGYTFKKGNTQEFYAAVRLPALLFQPSLTVYYDINLGDGLYVSLSGKHEIMLTAGLKLTVNAALGYNNRQWTDASGLSDFQAGLALPLTLDNATVVPFIKYSHIFLEELNDNKNEIWFGVSLLL